MNACLRARRDDLERLAGSVNRMLDRLESLMNGMREVGNDIAHDLRTPLSRVRAKLERALSTGGPRDTLEGLSPAQWMIWTSVWQLSRLCCGLPKLKAAVVGLALLPQSGRSGGGCCGSV